VAKTRVSMRSVQEKKCNLSLEDRIESFLSGSLMKVNSREMAFRASYCDTFFQYFTSECKARTRLSARRLKGIFIQFIEEFDQFFLSTKRNVQNDEVIIFILKLKIIPQSAHFFPAKLHNLA
jgi:hypothetical protein